jgi:hypothetical protein
MTGSFVRRVAATMGRAAFLFPDGVISPLRGFPPSIINFST